MAKLVVMPKLGLTMTEGTLSKWLKHEGDTVAAGDPLFEVETDKLTNTIEATDPGILRKIIAQEDAVVPCLEGVAVIAAADEDISGLLASAGAPAAPAAEEAAPAEATPAAAPVAVTHNGRVYITPIAKKLAEERGYDYTQIPGTGPNGRIVKKDVENYTPAPAAPAAPAAPKTKATPLAEKVAKDIDVDLSKVPSNGRVTAQDILNYLKASREVVKADEKPAEETKRMSAMRRGIAKNMSDSYLSTPVVTYNMHADMSACKVFREQLKNGGVKVSYTDILVKVCAMVLKEFPLLNCSVDGDNIIYKNYVNMGVAVALDNGLIVPNIPDADKKNLTQLSTELKEISAAARNGSLSMDRLSGGTFTISNLGMFGMDTFSPIINKPEVAILGVNAMNDEVVVVNGEMVIRPIMRLSLTADHRTVDGSEAAKFLGRVIEILENPALLMA